MQNEMNAEVNSAPYGVYEPSYKEMVERMWNDLSPELKKLAEFAEIAQEYVEHLRNDE